MISIKILERDGIGNAGDVLEWPDELREIASRLEARGVVRLVRPVTLLEAPTLEPRAA